MYYILAKEIIDKCIEVGLVHEQNGGIFVYHQASISEPEKYPEGWYLDDKEDTIRGLMHDENGQQILLRELEKKGVSMRDRFDYWDKIFDYWDKMLAHCCYR